jgi:peroxiredoxin Q/BCP
MRCARRLTPLVFMVVLGLASVPAGAQENPAALRVGDPAPAFQAVADDGKLWKSADHVGKKIVVVYFYPAAMTGGCTKQACGFRDNRSQLGKLGAIVVGVSGDRVGNLKAFKAANRLNFPLLADSSGAVARAFGVPLGEGGTITRAVGGRDVQLTRDVTAARWTFIVGKDRKVAFVETEVEPAGDGAAVLAAVRGMPRQ